VAPSGDLERNRVIGTLKGLLSVVVRHRMLTSLPAQVPGR